ncbi:MAG: hypothetical protein ACREFW_04875 [Rhizomicrobium sp.]
MPTQPLVAWTPSGLATALLAWLMPENSPSLSLPMTAKERRV